MQEATSCEINHTLHKHIEKELKIVSTEIKGMRKSKRNITKYILHLYHFVYLSRDIFSCLISYHCFHLIHTLLHIFFFLPFSFSVFLQPQPATIFLFFSFLSIYSFFLYVLISWFNFHSLSLKTKLHWHTVPTYFVLVTYLYSIHIHSIPIYSWHYLFRFYYTYFLSNPSYHIQSTVHLC